MLPQKLTILHATIPVLGILLGLVILNWLFIIWRESKKDGFDEFRLLDIGFLSLILTSSTIVFFTYLLDWLTIYDPASFIFNFNPLLTIYGTGLWVSWLPILLLTKKRKWSTYRVLDIYCVADGLVLLGLCLGLYFLGHDIRFLYVTISLLLMNVFVLRFRGYKFISGMVFTLFNLFLGLLGGIFLQKTDYLLFLTVQLTISLLTFYFIRKRVMTNSFLSPQFIKDLKAKLLSKKKDLDLEEKLIVAEDPAKQVDRTTDNGDYVDDVMLEDLPMEISRAVKQDINAGRTQVNNSLTAMKNGTYGLCEVCGQQIDKARLKVYPEVATCKECADTLDKKEALHS